MGFFCVMLYQKGAQKALGGSVAGMDDLNRPRGYSALENITLGGVTQQWGQAGFGKGDSSIGQWVVSS